ncbi:RDD family protein [bacterium]|nr:RDD family protein [bacterium]
MYCPNCGAQSPDKVNFCGSCGAKLTDSAAPAASDPPPKCPECSGENDLSAQFCRHCGASLKAQTAGAFSPAGQMYIPPPRVDYAGFWRRFVAFIIDMIAIGIVTSLLRLFTGGSLIHQPTMMHGCPNYGAMFLSFSNIASIVITWLYFALLESSTRQATFGKMALGLFVTDLEGNRLSFTRASGRYFSKIISGMTMTIGFLMAGFTAKKQALHDMIAGCLVLVRR